VIEWSVGPLAGAGPAGGTTDGHQPLPKLIAVLVTGGPISAGPDPIIQGFHQIAPDRLVARFLVRMSLTDHFFLS
jgi:hypothetical protein